MRKKITKEWLHEKQACSSGIRWFLSQDETEPINVLRKLIGEGNSQDANWLVSRLINKKQCVQYAIFAAEQVIGIYEKKSPGEDRPRKAIEAAKAYLKNPCKRTKDAAAAAAYAAAAAADAAAADAADAAAAYAAAAAAAAAAYAATRKEMRLKILEHGIKILEGK